MSNDRRAALIALCLAIGFIGLLMACLGWGAWPALGVLMVAGSTIGGMYTVDRKGGERMPQRIEAVDVGDHYAVVVRHDEWNSVVGVWGPFSTREGANEHAERLEQTGALVGSTGNVEVWPMLRVVGWPAARREVTPNGDES